MASSRSFKNKIRSKGDAISYFSSHQRIRGCDMQVSKVHSLSWNCDGTKLACGSHDRRVAVAAVDSGCRLKLDFVASGHDDTVDQVAFQYSSPYVFASASLDRSICVWDMRAKSTQRKLSTRAPNLYVTWTPSGKHFIYGDKDNKIHIVDGRTSSIIKSVDIKVELNEIVCHPSGEYLFVATGGGKVEIFSLPDLKPLRSIQALSTQSSCLSIAITSDGSKMVVGGNDALCTLWNLDEFICESTIARLDYPVRTVSVNAFGNLIACGSEDHCIDIGWLDDGAKVSDIRVDGEVFSTAWHPKQPILAFASVSSEARDRDSVRLWGFTS
ncbi:unnamed protein product [Auanema sp. JU1783]|nr:unnamed protein product [Auanema sp. JU1783]